MAEKIRPTSFPYVTDTVFPCYARAACYRAMVHADGCSLREPVRLRTVFPYSERHLHCVWFDPEWRPRTLCTREGEPVEVESPGVWNREAGPDFLGAVLRIGTGARRVAGDVEIHVHPSDWKAHGHADDPRYRQVRFHVTYFPGAPDAVGLVPGSVQIVLKDVLGKQPGFSFDAIDTAAYPYAARADIPPCSVEMRLFDPDERRHILHAAGEERLRRKTERLAMGMEELGEDQALYEEVMTALGYKHNKTAFRAVARMVPLDVLRAESRGSCTAAFALLAGAGGLLPEPPRAQWTAETNRFIRRCWDVWWRYRDQLAARCMPPEWRMDGIRPANHPLRRLMGAAGLFTGPSSFREVVLQHAQQGGAEGMRAWMAQVSSVRDDYLAYRLSLTGAPRERPVALIGPTRAAAIFTNVIVPYLAVQGHYDTVCALLERMPAEADNAIIKQTAFYLFGRDHSPSVYRDALARQGLIQIFQDFCLNDRSRCAACLFPHALQQHNREGRQ